MKERRTATRHGGWIAPKSLFLGVAAAFLACSWAGHSATQESCLQRFKRFHQQIGIASLFYPTVSQARQYVRHHASKRQILVIVGGSSVLQGTGQRVEELWTDKLQAALGDDFRVFNFACQAGLTQEVGLAVAESLCRDYKKLIFVTDVTPYFISPEPDGATYKYFFWDAYYKGHLLQDEAREEQLRSVLEYYKTNPTIRRQNNIYAETLETKRGAWLDSRLYFNDLWNSLAYTTVSTVWNPLARPSEPFYTPRKDFRDGDPGAPPLEQRYVNGYEYDLAATRGLATVGCVQQSDGKWVLDTNSLIPQTLKQCAKAAIPERIRRQTLLLMDHYSPYYVTRLSIDEQKSMTLVYERGVRVLKESGFSILEIEKDFSADDYIDRAHLAASGGVKLAAEVAPEVRTMAEKLGYLGESPKTR